MATPTRKIDRRIRSEVYERDGYTCQYLPYGKCAIGSAQYVLGTNDQYALSLDHIKPMCMGGGDTVDNFITVHRLCNSLRQDKSLEEWLGVYA